MKNNSSLALMVLAIIILQCCRPTDKAESMGDRIQTTMFLEKAALMATLETEWGKLASEKARDIKLRDFGKGVAKDQTEIKGSLSAIVMAKGFKLPTALPIKEQERLGEMRRMEDHYFEKLYLKMSVEDYRKNIELFRGARNSPDTTISNFARRFLPVLEKHQLQALELRGDR